MPTEKVNFGKPYQGFTDEQYRDGIVQSLKDGYMDTDGSFVKRPGLTTFATTPTSANVSSVYESVNDYFLSVSSGKLYNIVTAGTAGSATEITGAGLSANSLCTFAEDRTNIYVAHQLGYLCQVASGLGSYSAMTATGHPLSASHIVFQQGHLLCNPPIGVSAGTGSVVAGDVAFNNLAGYPGSGWRVYNNESVPDSCNALFTLWDEIYAFGPRSIETSWNDGSTPWAKSNAPTLNYGCVAPRSVVRVGQTVFWLSMFDDAYRVMRMQDRRGEVVSTPFDTLIQTLTAHSSAIGATMAIGSHQFYLLNFNTSNITLAYNLTTKTWSQWGYYTGGAYSRYLGNTAKFWRAQNKTLVGTVELNGNIYTPTGYTDNGNAVRFELTSGNQSFGSDRKKTYNWALLKWRSTNAANTFKLQWRDQGGPWHDEVTVGPQGYARDTYFARLNRLGASRERNWRVIHDNTSYPFTFVSMEVNYTVDKV